MSVFHKLGETILPDRLRRRVRDYVLKTGINKDPLSLYGLLFLLSTAATVVLYLKFIYPNLKTASPVFLAGVSVFGVIGINLVIIVIIGLFLWLYYEFLIFRRTMQIETVLPDFLQEVSVNLRAGMSFDKALWNSIEPEFGVLEKEIEIVAKKAMTGKDTEDALKEFSEKYNSTLLQECIDLLIIGIRSGGDVSDLIDRIVDNVKDAYYLRKELIASVTSYVIFIAFTAVLISPTLFALSFNLMEIIQGLGERISVTSSSGILPLPIGFKSIDPDDFILFSQLSVVIISTMAAMIIADLREGSVKAGLKYLFVFIPISYLAYMAMLTIFTSLFGIMV